MKINIADKKWVSKDYQKLLWMLEQNQDFETKVQDIRKSIKSKKLSDEELEKSVINLLDEFNLPQNILREFTHYIKEDSMPLLFLTPGIELQSLGFTPDVLLQKKLPRGQRREVRIIITEQVSKEKLVNWINQNWESITHHLLTLELPKVKIPKWGRLNTAKKIVEWHDKDKLSFSKITDKLGAYDENTTKSIYYRYKKRMKQK